jgi:hypothetical protein
MAAPPWRRIVGNLVLRIFHRADAKVVAYALINHVNGWQRCLPADRFAE